MLQLESLNFNKLLHEKSNPFLVKLILKLLNKKREKKKNRILGLGGEEIIHENENECSNLNPYESNTTWKFQKP